MNPLCMCILVVRVRGGVGIDMGEKKGSKVSPTRDKVRTRSKLIGGRSASRRPDVLGAGHVPFIRPTTAREHNNNALQSPTHLSLPREWAGNLSSISGNGSDAEADSDSDASLPPPPRSLPLSRLLLPPSPRLLQPSPPPSLAVKRPRPRLPTWLMPLLPSARETSVHFSLDVVDRTQHPHKMHQRADHCSC